MKKILKFIQDGFPRWGVLGEDLNTIFGLEGKDYFEWKQSAPIASFPEVQLLPPCEPRTVVGLAYNFKDLVGPRTTYEEPLLFLKSPACLIGHKASIELPTSCQKVWAEVEIALVIGRTIFQPTIQEAASAIFGWTVANDVTAENNFKRDHHLARSKSLATFCPIGPYLITGTPNQNIQLKTKINGTVTQNGNSKNRILTDLEAVMLVAKVMPLCPGDVILTGTPKGAMDSQIHAGDTVCCEAENFICLENSVTQRVVSF